MWRDFSKALRELRRTFFGEGGGSYRPDLHYMRGPGPKWHAKYGGPRPSIGAYRTVWPVAARDMAEHRA